MSSEEVYNILETIAQINVIRCVKNKHQEMEENLANEIKEYSEDMFTKILEVHKINIILIIKFFLIRIYLIL